MVRLDVLYTSDLGSSPSLKTTMKIKSKGKSGTRSICICQNCGEEFSELNTKIRAGGGKFCCNDCYKEFRSKNKKDPKELNRLYQKKYKYGLSKEDYYSLFETQQNKCAICGVPNVWNNKELVFILDHINGRANDNSRNNLRLICPNCDSQLDTYKSKNKNSDRQGYRKTY